MPISECMRYPAVAGQFYEGEEKRLRMQIEMCFRHNLGPGSVPTLEQGPRRIKGLVVPHAGFMYSGPVACHSYAHLAKDGFPESFIILGPNHTGYGSPASLADDDFETPLGVAHLERELSNSLRSEVITVDPIGHRHEHSIEVQLPFLQFLRPEIKFVPISLMAQGIDGSRTMLLRRFQEETQSVLFGTDSFWEGIDVPGHALEIVVISRLPFAVPTDPIVQAQTEEVARMGINPFMGFTVPEAAIKLRQGAGRLIRHRSDRGAVIICDNRVSTTRYGPLFMKSLQGTPLVAENPERLIEQLKSWFGS